MRTTVFILSTLAALVLTGCQCGGPCAAGAQGCGCLDGVTCNAGLVCGADQKCSPAVAAEVQISDASARGCELLLTETDATQVSSVTFKNGARGTWVREAPRVAITVVSGGDTALAGAVQLGLTGAATELTLSKAGCVDLKGQRLASTLSLR